MVRVLTSSEVQVIGALLASGRVTERSRLQRANVPRSTFHAARRRAYQEGWLRDRYIPNPVEFGFDFAVFCLVRPYADRLREFLADRMADRSTVYLAHSTHSALSIEWYESEEAARSAAARPSEGGFASWSFPIVANLREPSVPVYFDFEGSFAHLGDVAGPEGYPQGLGGRLEGPSRATEPASELRTGWAVTELVHRPFLAVEQGRPVHLVGPFGLPWGQQKLLNSGGIQHRVLLDPGRLPPFQGRSADQEVFIGGTLRAESRAEELFSALTRQCRVYPFLFATSGRRLLIGAVAQPPGRTVPVSASGDRPSVLRTLQDRVEGIEIVQEPVSTGQVDLDHRYDRLFPRTR